MQLAPVFRWHGHWIKSSRELASCLEAGLQEEAPNLALVTIDYRENNKLTEKPGQVACPI